MSGSIYLKSCPLCGWIAEMKTKASADASEGWRQSLSHGKDDITKALAKPKKYTPYYWVICTHCNYKTKKYTTPIDAITAWNRRPDPRSRRPFPPGPWKYLPHKEHGRYTIVNTSLQLEVKNTLFDIVLNQTARISKLSQDAIVRLVTAAPAMYERLYKALDLLDELTLQEANLDQESLEKLRVKCVDMRSEIELLLAGIEGASEIFDPETDQPVLSKLPQRGRRKRQMAKIVQTDAPYITNNTEDSSDKTEYDGTESNQQAKTVVTTPSDSE